MNLIEMEKVTLPSSVDIVECLVAVQILQFANECAFCLSPLWSRRMILSVGLESAHFTKSIVDNGKS